MSAAPHLVTVPTQPDVDKLAEEYQSLEKEFDRAEGELKAAAKKLDEKADELIRLVTSFGSAHAEKSKLLHGIRFEIMSTYGISTSVDGAAVERFRLELVKAKQARLLKKIFEKTVRWNLSPVASVIIQAEKKLSNKLLALYSQCTVTKPKKPSLIVRPKKLG
jgi:septal ring factor EnvC (AmiA/AmiB activator)